MYQLAEVREKLRILGISPKKSLGQNFLINPQTAQKIVGELSRISKSMIVEVGPGLGALTDYLKDFSEPILLIELDKVFAEFWRQKNMTVIEADALQIDWAAQNLPEGTSLISNLPYQISSSLVIDRSVFPCGVNSMVLMFQKEVAQRITGKMQTKEYGLLSVIAQTFWDITVVSDAGPKDFFPPPQVGSRILKFLRSNRRVEDPEGFLKFVKLAFSQRRKFLIKNLEGSSQRRYLVQAFEELNLDLKSRAEDLSPKLLLDVFLKLRNCE